MAWPTVAISTTSMDASSDDASQARAEIKQMADNVNIIKDARSQASGIASLDAGGKVPTGELPTLPANQGGTGHTGFTVGDILYANSASALQKLAAGSAGTVLTSNGPGSAPSYQIAGGVPSGTRMPFNQTAAPTGWTKDTTAGLNDSIMRIVTGTVSSGGSTAFSTFNGQTATGAHTLTLAQIPSHDHFQRVNTTTNNTNQYNATQGLTSTGSSATPVSTGLATSSVGSGGSHSHTMTTSIKYNDFIIATKD